MTATRAHLWISGQVQGVNFRYYTRQQALRLGLTGWVRNLWDGRVEVLLEGEEAFVRQMVDWCHTGPSAAYVVGVEIEWESSSGTLDNFDIQTTASGR